MIKTASTLPRPFFERAEKIGKNNPKESEIKADNEARQEWNHTVDIALVDGVPESEIMVLKQEEISSKIQKSINAFGKSPERFRPIVKTAKEILLGLLQKWRVPPKPRLSVDIAEFRKLEAIKAELDEIVQEIRHLEKIKLPDLERTRNSLKGMFKAKERKRIESEIDDAKSEISRLKSELKHLVNRHDYKNVQSFMNVYSQSRDAVLQYQTELKTWQAKNGKNPPRKESLMEQLKRYELEVKKQKPARMNQRKKQRETSHCER